ncbi:MAG: hypothetical protein M1820_005704 [Bogoriella megaspora]|nr:MAG: hypothetical protein M1820_005704 [Bogoriella megaspora]
MGRYPEDLDGSSDSSYSSYGSGYSYSNNPSDIDRRAIARYTPSENLDMLRGLVEQLVPDQEAVDWISDYINVLEDQLGTQDTIIRYFKSLASPTATTVATPSLPKSMPPSTESEASAESESTATKLRKLTPKQKAKLAGEDRCFRCRGKGHYSYNDCCPNNQWKRRKAIPAATPLPSPSAATSDIPAVPAPAPPIAVPPAPIPPSAATSATPEVKPEPNTAIKSEPHASPPITPPATAAPGPPTDVKSEVKSEPPDSPAVKPEPPDSPAVKSEPPDLSAIPVYIIKNGTFEEVAATPAATPATPPSHSAGIAKWPEKSRLPLFLTKPWQLIAG